MTQNQDPRELTSSYLVQLDASYELFHMTERIEEVILSLYSTMMPVLQSFAKDGLSEDNKYFKYTKLFPLVLELVKRIERFETLTGDEKKQLLIDILVIIVDRELMLDPISKQVLITLIGVIVPTIIDSIVDVGKAIKKSSCVRKIRRSIARKLTCGVYKKR